MVGIVAGRVKERFNRPACVAGVAGGIAKGSGRSVPGVDLGGAVIAARQAGLLETGGGHAMAAGFSFAVERWDEVHAFLNERLQGAAALPGAADLLGGGRGGGGRRDHRPRACRWSAWRPSARATRSRTSCCRAPAWCGRTGWARRATRCAPSSKARAAGRLKAICFRAKEGPLAQALLGSGGVPLHLCGTLRAERWNDSVTACLHVVDAAPVPPVAAGGDGGV